MQTSALVSVPLPGALTLRRLDLVGRSQTPHVHLAHRVAYLCLGGEAIVRCLNLSDGLAEHILTPEVVVSLEAGVLHALEAKPLASLLVIVEQAGQLEAGETVFTFPMLALADQQAYWSCAAPSREATPEAEERRLALCRDLAWNGFLELCTAFERSRQDGEVALSRFYQLAMHLVHPEAARVRSAWRASTLREVAHAAFALANLEHERIKHLLPARTVCQTLSASEPHKPPAQASTSDAVHASVRGQLLPIRGGVTDDQPSSTLARAHITTWKGTCMSKRLALAIEDGLLMAQEGTGRWQSTLRLDGYPITCFAVDALCPRRMYCGIAGRGLLLSTNAGITWQPVEEGLISPSVTAVAVSRTERRGELGVVYAGTEPSALFFSEDGGGSWLECVALNHVPSRGQWRWPCRPYSHAVRWIEPDVHEPARLFVAVTMGGVLCSQDGGLSFKPLEGGFPDVHHLCTHPSTPGLLYQVGVGSETLLAYDLAGRVFPAPELGGCARSHDAGANWQQISEGIKRHRSLWRLALDPGDPETLLASATVGSLQAHLPGFAEAVLYRKRAGRAWQQVSLGLPEPEGTTCYALWTHDEELGVFYAATGRGVYRSLDAGESWHVLLPLLPRFHFKRVVALAVWRDH